MMWMGYFCMQIFNHEIFYWHSKPWPNQRSQRFGNPRRRNHQSQLDGQGRNFRYWSRFETLCRYLWNCRRRRCKRWGNFNRLWWHGKGRRNVGQSSPQYCGESAYDQGRNQGHPLFYRQRNQNQLHLGVFSRTGPFGCQSGSVLCFSFCWSLRRYLYRRYSANWADQKHLWQLRFWYRNLGC